MLLWKQNRERKKWKGQLIQFPHQYSWLNWPDCCSIIWGACCLGFLSVCVQGVQFQEQLWLDFWSIQIYTFPSSSSLSPSNVSSLPWRQRVPRDLLSPKLFTLSDAQAKLCPPTSKVPFSPFLRWKKLGLIKGSFGQGPSWSYQAERASTSLSEGSLDVNTYHSLFPIVESSHLFQKMPNVFYLSISVICP